MNLLPYELLQLIASNLLPRYQCRVALTSRHCYKYLYNDILRWHAQKYTIEVPKHEIKEDVQWEYITVLYVSSRVIFYRKVWNNNNLVSLNYTTCVHTIFMPNEYILPLDGLSYKVSPITMYYDVERYMDWFIGPDKYYKYIHKDYILAFLNMQCSYYKLGPLRIIIRNLLDDNSIQAIKSCEHMQAVMGVF